MNLTPEQESELAQFPAVLRTLVEAELAAGNAITEIGHSFPAPPAGAYFKLARKIGTRPRSSGDDLIFYERNSSLYSGEFTDAKRFHFVLEPPNQPPLPPDMDAIRKASEIKPRRSKPPLAPKPPRSNPRPPSPAQSEVTTRADGKQTTSAATPHPVTGSPTGISRTLVFQDIRAPHQIQHRLERDLMTLFVPRMDLGTLTLVGHTMNVGCPYRLELRLDAVLPQTNFYSLRIEADWSALDTSNHEYYLNNFDGWFRVYTRDLQPSQPPITDKESVDRYETLANQSLSAEQHLDSIPRIQQAILESMRQGASFSVCHKEGGTNIYWRDGSFVRSDYGEEPARRTFASEQEFLDFLRQFYDWETSRNVYPNKLADIDAWRLIYRLLRPV